MSDKVRQMTNQVVLTGKVTEFEMKTGTVANGDSKGAPYVSIKGEIQFGEHKAMARSFERYVQEYRVKDGKKIESKAYTPTLDWAKSVKSVAKTNWDEATEVSLTCSFAPNDYVNKEEKLIEALKCPVAFINDVNGDYKATADIEGYIQSIVPETKGEDQAETGRLKVTILTNDFFGNIIPVKNIIVPEELREAFEDGYEVGQTAKVFVDFTLHKGEEKPKKSGGIGVQRTTDGKSYVEMILTGADPALDEDEEDAFSKEAVRIGLAERKADLDKLKEAGYQGGKGEGKSISSASANSKPKPVTDDEIPF